MRPFLLAAILMFSSLCSSAEVDKDFWVQRWKSESTWVRDLQREEQSVVIHLLLKQLTDRMNDGMAQAKNNGQKSLIMKAFFDGIALLPELAIHSPELKKSLEFYGDIFQRLAKGQIKTSQLGAEMEKNDRQLDLALATVPSNYFNTVPIRYKRELTRTSAGIVVTALKLNDWQYGEK